MAVGMARRKSKRLIGNITAIQIVRVWRKSSFIHQDNGAVSSEDYPQSLNHWKSSRVIALSVICVNKGEIRDPCRCVLNRFSQISQTIFPYRINCKADNHLRKFA